MQQIAEAIVNKYFGISPHKVTSLGGGFYGRVFLAEVFAQPEKVVIKIYLPPNLAAKEARQIKTLSAYATVKMPEVFAVYKADSNIPNDAIIMEYIPGLNAGDNSLKIQEDNRMKIADQIVENLLSYHKVIHPYGFGEIGANSFEPDWRKWYKIKADGALSKAELLHRHGKIDDSIFSVMRKAHELYDKIFYLPITEARLIHGDYNTWNILLDENLTCVKAVIDPFNCCWADSELDLYQLNNANGIEYGLLEKYAGKISLSENFALKLSFYELFSEITHFYDANVEVDISRTNVQVKNLEHQMECYNLL